jgi:spore coat polysaccharide biosynthesis predicted glycosyltransferase SpsG
MSTVREMVESLGSQPYVAIKLGVSSRTIRNWIASNQIGRASRLDFLKMLKQAGYKDVTLKQLNELEPTKTKKAVTSLTKGKMESVK